MHERTNAPEAICSSNFLEVGGIMMRKTIIVKMMEVTLTVETVTMTDDDEDEDVGGKQDEDDDKNVDKSNNDMDEN